MSTKRMKLRGKKKKFSKIKLVFYLSFLLAYIYIVHKRGYKVF